MNILMIDTSGPACGVAIMADGRLVYEAELTHKQTHSPVSYTHLDVYKRQVRACELSGAVYAGGFDANPRDGDDVRL